VRIGVDGRSLTPDGRGIAHYTEGMIRALASAGAEIRVLLPRGTITAASGGREPAPTSAAGGREPAPTSVAGGREPAPTSAAGGGGPAGAPASGGIVAVRHALPSRVLFGAAAVSGRPRLDQLVGPVDVVWLPAPAPVAVGRTPYALTLHDLSFLERPGDFTAYERVWHRLARPRALARGAARVLAVSAATARLAHERLGVAAAVVPGGPGDPGPPVSADEVAAVRARHGIPDRYFLFVGALEPRKGLDRLVAAHEGLEPALVLAGEGRLGGQLRGAGVRLVGRVSRADKAALYAGALAVVLPSWCEGYGYPPLEGFAHGTPAIVSDLPALRETAGDGALYVPPGDVPALAAALRQIADDDSLRARLAAGGEAALRARSWAASGRALLAALEAAAGASPPAPGASPEAAA
jgi:glycosyltransferase involved in cell wall biosynthesis